MINAIFFLSGVAALLFENIWFRQAGLIFGNSVWASSLVLSSFMAGLALGNGLVAFRPQKHGDALRRYAFLELIVGITGFGLVLLLPRIGESLFPLLATLVDNPVALGAVRFVLAFSMMVIPTAAMGMTLPILVDRAPSRELFGVTLSRLYGWNTLGAVFGCIAGEALLYGKLGVLGTGVVAGLLNFTAALLSVWLARTETLPTSPSGPAPAFRWTMDEMRLLAIATIAGACLLALEVVWTRFLLLFVFGTSITFAIMLGFALGGLSLGSLLVSLAPGLSRAQGAVPMLVLLAATSLTASYAAIADGLRVNFTDVPGAPFPRVMFLSAILILPTSVISGALFSTIGAALAARGERRPAFDERRIPSGLLRSAARIFPIFGHFGSSPAGRTARLGAAADFHHRLQAGGNTATRVAGMLTLFNTLGAMVGAVIAGFVLLPSLGMERSFQLLAIVYVLAALLAPGFTTAIRGSRPLALAAGAALLFTALFPRGLMERVYLKQTFGDFGPESHVTEVREGLTETITFVDTTVQGEKLYSRLVTNGFSMSGTMFVGRRYMEAFVYLPVAIHPGMRRALLISYGVGSTARALTETRELEHIDVVDISRDILEMAPLAIAPGDPEPLKDPRVVTHVEDGRFFLQTAREGYDLITSEPPPPHLGGVINLYTREYFQLIRDRLNPGGITSYWLPVHSLSDNDTRAISSAFCAVFEDCTLWKGANLDWILIGTRDLKGPVTPDRFRAQWAPGGPTDLRDLGFEIPEQLGSLFMAEGRDFPELTNQPALEDNFPSRLGHSPPEPVVFGPWRIDLMDADAGRRRFMASRFIQQAWPEQLREATLPYFPLQTHHDEMIKGFLGRPPDSMQTKDALAILRNTPLQMLPAVMLGTPPDILILARRVEARGGPTPPWLLPHLGVRDIGARQYSAAAERFRRAMAADPGLPGIGERLILALCLDGKRSEAQAERTRLGLKPDRGWAEGLDDACREHAKPS